MVKQPIPIELLERLSNLLVSKIGLHVPKNNWINWENKIYPLAKAFGFENINECISWLTTASLRQEELDILARHLTIGETYFFRDANAFKALEETILTDLIKQRADSKFLRIWCAACCTGEEPYSIAMLLHDLIPDLSTWNIHILGTDINPDFLQTCESGIYREWSFRLTAEAMKKKYFVRLRGGDYKIAPEIRGMVKFMHLNLIEDKYPMLLNGTHAMDVILCNNLLIYFSQDKIQHVVRQLSSALIDGGWLLTSPIEVPYILEKSLVPRKIHLSTFFKKQLTVVAEAQPEAVVAAESPAPAPFFSENATELLEPLPSPVESSTFPGEPQIFLFTEYFQLYAQGSYAEIVEKLEKTLSGKGRLPLTKQAIPSILLLAKSYASMGNLVKAFQWISQGLAIEKLDPELYLLQAMIHQESAQLEEAVESLQKALFIDPSLIMGYYALGNLMMKKGNEQEKERCFRNALVLLKKMGAGAEIPSSDGMAVAQLVGILSTLTAREE